MIKVKLLKFAVNKLEIKHYITLINFKNLNQETLLSFFLFRSY